MKRKYFITGRKRRNNRTEITSMGRFDNKEEVNVGKDHLKKEGYSNIKIHIVKI